MTNDLSQICKDIFENHEILKCWIEDDNVVLRLKPKKLDNAPKIFNRFYKPIFDINFR